MPSTTRTCSGFRTRGYGLVLAVPTMLIGGAVLASPVAGADNKRLNDGVVANVYTVQHQAGCTNDVRIDPRLQLAAQWHTNDVLNNRSLDGDLGSDGSTAQDRANGTGFHGKVAETVAINPALAISGMEVINQWYHNPADFAVMANCANTAIGVWSEDSSDRSVVVAVYGQPTDAPPPGNPPVQIPGFDPNPDYDASDELEFGINWFPWILRGVYPPPGYPPK